MTPQLLLFALTFVVLYYAVTSGAAEEGMSVYRERNARKIIYPNPTCHPDL